MRAMAGGDFGGFHDGFGECRVRMDGQGQVLRGRAHFDGEHAFGNHIAHAGLAAGGSLTGRSLYNILYI